MLKDRLYQIINIVQHNNDITVQLLINPANPIFAGHFPGQPVLPGACLLNMVQEVLSIALQSKCQLKKANALKFIAPVDPTQNPSLELKLNYVSVDAGLRLTASLSVNEVVYFKMQGIYSESV